MRRLAAALIAMLVPSCAALGCRAIVSGAVVGNVRAERGLRMEIDGAQVRGHSVSGALIFR